MSDDYRVISKAMLNSMVDTFYVPYLGSVRVYLFDKNPNVRVEVKFLELLQSDPTYHWLGKEGELT